MLRHWCTACDGDQPSDSFIPKELKLSRKHGYKLKCTTLDNVLDSYVFNVLPYKSVQLATKQLQPQSTCITTKNDYSHKALLHYSYTIYTPDKSHIMWRGIWPAGKKISSKRSFHHWVTECLNIFLVHDIYWLNKSVRGLSTVSTTSSKCYKIQHNTTSMIAKSFA